MDSEEEKLFPYQLEGAKFLASKKLALLADEMGVGKTAQVIRACDLINAERILVLCPAVARINWIREFQRFSTRKRSSYAVMESQRPLIHSNLTVCSYDLATTCLQKLLASLCGNSWDLLVLDEVHFLKNPEAKRTRTVFGTQGLIRKAKRCWAVSGTPSPNHAGELWTLLYTFGATPLSYSNFIDRFCVGYMGPKRFVVTGSNRKNVPELKEILRPIILRRKKEEVMKELPPIHFDHVTVEAGPVDLDIDPWFVEYVFPYDRRHELTAKIEKERTLVEGCMVAAKFGADGLRVLEAISKSISSLRRYTGLQKVPAIIEMITEEMNEGFYEKLVIFALHRSVIEALREGLRKFKPVVVYGGTDPAKRQRHIDNFMNNKRVKIFIGNIQACGTAITLTSSNQVIFVEQSFSPADNAQAAMRCHRIGQSKPVFVRCVGLADSIDEKINLILKRKTKDLAEIFDAPLSTYDDCEKQESE